MLVKLRMYVYYQLTLKYSLKYILSLGRFLVEILVSFFIKLSNHNWPPKLLQIQVRYMCVHMTQTKGNPNDPVAVLIAIA